MWLKFKFLLPMRWRRFARLTFENFLAYFTPSIQRPEILPRSNQYDVICFPDCTGEFEVQPLKELLLQFVRHKHRVFYIDTQAEARENDQDVTFSEMAPFLYRLHLPPYIQMPPPAWLAGYEQAGSLPA